MKKTYKILNVDCANCARKMEDKINKIDGVEKVTINFLTGKLIIEGDEGKWDDIMTAAAKICRKIDAGAVIEL